MADQRDGGIAWTDATSVKWCWACESVHPRESFGRDSSRPDGLAAQCLESRRVKQRRLRVLFKRHGRLVPARDGDRRQARRRVNYLVEQGRIPRPGDLPCVDCGHIGKGPRHEYDHHRGYEAAHHETVEPVCAPCHHAREGSRGAHRD